MSNSYSTALLDIVFKIVYDLPPITARIVEKIVESLSTRVIYFRYVTRIAFSYPFYDRISRLQR
jgi:hypothetical protein